MSSRVCNCFNIPWRRTKFTAKSQGPRAKSSSFRREGSSTALLMYSWVGIGSSLTPIKLLRCIADCTAPAGPGIAGLKEQGRKWKSLELVDEIKIELLRLQGRRRRESSASSMSRASQGSGSIWAVRTCC